jgi:plastocyanin domain-containing protein
MGESVNGTDWLVLLAGFAAIAWVNWYFFFARRVAAAPRLTSGTQQIEIEVRGGYDPGVVRVKRGSPVRLVFNRTETSSCSEEVVLPAFGIRRFLPAFKKTAVELTPGETGRFEITCGMSMLHGTLLVED